MSVSTTLSAMAALAYHRFSIVSSTRKLLSAEMGRRNVVAFCFVFLIHFLSFLVTGKRKEKSLKDYLTIRPFLSFLPFLGGWGGGVAMKVFYKDFFIFYCHMHFDSIIDSKLKISDSWFI